MTEHKETKAARFTRRGAAGTLTLSGSVDIFEAQPVLAAAKRAMDDTQSASVCVDLRAVSRLDLSSLQILCALRRDLEAAGRSWNATTPDTLESNLLRAGLSL